MDIRKLQRAIVDGLEDVKAHNIVVFNTEHLSSMFERVIVASGNSNRQTKALASSVRELVKARGLPVLSVEGADNGEWIIVDCGAAVAHIMQPAIRDYYRLEEIWGDKPVKMRIDGEALADAAKAARVASKPTAAKQAPAKRAPTKRAPAKTAVTRGSAKKKATAPPRTATKPARAGARKGPARKR
jgi:ribosome-associated protein